MTDKSQIKQKIREIYEVLPKLDDQRCGYKSCGEFARAVAEGRAPCHGCVSGGPEVAAKVCEIVGKEVPEEAKTDIAYTRFPQPATPGARIGRGRGMGRRAGRGRGGGRGGFGRRSGRGRGWNGNWSRGR